MKVSFQLAARRLAICLVGILLVGASGPCIADDGNKLHGQVEEAGVLPSLAPTAPPLEPMPVPVVRPRKSQQKPHGDKGPIKGREIQDRASSGEKGGTLKARIEHTADPDLEQGKLAPRNEPLQGSATKDDLSAGVSGSDPDAGDKELQIEWDRWRNRLLHAIQSGMQESLNNPSEATLRWDPSKQAMVSRFPTGTVAWFSCQVTPDQRVIHIKLLHSSGYPGYDRAVLDAIDALQGSSILRYPRGSRRQIVTQVAGIKTAEQAEYRHFKFGDVERHRVPVGDGF